MLKYRNELKYLVSQAEIEMIRHRIQGIMQQDKHQIGDGYNIRSLYFDDYDNSCMSENEAGVDERCKYRLRIYNHSASRISLEIKSKKRGLTNKRSCFINQEQCQTYLEDALFTFSDNMPEAMKELEIERRLRLMKPVCVVEYERTAYVYPLGNVRITFDKNISASFQTHQFLEENMMLRPVLPSGQHILEVKYDEFLPDYIAQVLEIEFLQRTSFSKYYLSRV